jgi:hypothetical protein
VEERSTSATDRRQAATLRVHRSRRTLRSVAPRTCCDVSTSSQCVENGGSVQRARILRRFAGERIHVPALQRASL